MNLICKWRGHKWVDASSILYDMKNGTETKTKEIASRCARCDKFEVMARLPYKSGATHRERGD